MRAYKYSELNKTTLYFCDQFKSILEFLFKSPSYNCAANATYENRIHLANHSLLNLWREECVVIDLKTDTMCKITTT